MNDFLDPKSMITPGISGGVIMVISNTLWMQFSLPKVFSSIVLSFLLVTLIISKFPAPIWEKSIYFIFNGLIIFSFAINTNFAGREISAITSNENNNALKQHSTKNYQACSNECPKRPLYEGVITIPGIADYRQETSKNIVPSTAPNPTKKTFFDPYW